MNAVNSQFCLQLRPVQSRRIPIHRLMTNSIAVEGVYRKSSPNGVEEVVACLLFFWSSGQRVGFRRRPPVLDNAFCDDP